MPPAIPGLPAPSVGAVLPVIWLPVMVIVPWLKMPAPAPPAAALWSTELPWTTALAPRRGLAPGCVGFVVIAPAAVQGGAAAVALRWGRFPRPAGDPAAAGGGVVIDPAGVKDGRAGLVQDAAGVLRGGVAGHRAGVQ